MEKQEHKDDLEGFVRASFEAHEEMPSNDMWQRIEPELLSENLNIRNSILRKFRWQMLAASIIFLLFSGIICEYVYYNRKIVALLSTQPGLELVQNTENSASVSPSSDKVTKENGKANITAKNSSTKHNRVAIPTVKQQNNALVRSEFSQKQSIDYLLPVKKNLPNASENQYNDNRLNPIDLIPVQTDGKTEPAVAALDYIDRLPLRTSSFSNKQPVIYFSNRPGLSPVKVFNPNKGWYVSLALTPGFTTQKAHMMSRTGVPGMRPVFASSATVNTLTNDIWLKTGTRFANGWGIETGLGYRRSETEATHLARFRFSERKLPSSAIDPGNYDFNYDLDAYGGSAAVSLRVAQTDNTITVQDNEVLGLEINSRQKVEMIRLPVLLTKQWGTNKLRFNAKIGMVANYIFSNEITIDKFESLTGIFRNATRAQAIISRQQPNKFRLGTIAAAGLSYQLNSNWSFLLEPTFARDFAQVDGNKNRLPTQVTKGLTLGATLSF